MRPQINVKLIRYRSCLTYPPVDRFKTREIFRFFLNRVFFFTQPRGLYQSRMQMKMHRSRWPVINRAFCLLSPAEVGCDAGNPPPSRGGKKIFPAIPAQVPGGGLGQLLSRAASPGRNY